MKKLAFFALCAASAAALVLTGCPHTENDFLTGETYDLVTFADNWGAITIPASSFENMTTTNNAQRITMEYELSESYAMVRFHYNPSDGWVKYDGKYYDASDDTVCSGNSDGYVGPKSGVYITPNDEQLARLKKEGLAIQIWGVKVSKVTATYIGEEAEKVVLVDTDFNKTLDGTTTGGRIVPDLEDPTIDVWAITGKGKVPGDKPVVGGTYAFSGVADLSKKKKITINFHTPEFKNGYDEVGKGKPALFEKATLKKDSTTEYENGPYLLTTEAITVKNYGGEEVSIPVGTIYNRYGNPKSDFWVYMVNPADENTPHYGVTISGDDKNFGISTTSNGTALNNEAVYNINKNNKLALVLYTDDDNYFIYYITNGGDGFPSDLDADEATQSFKLADFTEVNPEEKDTDGNALKADAQIKPDFAKIAGVKVLTNSCKGTLYIKSITFE